MLLKLHDIQTWQYFVLEITEYDVLVGQQYLVTYAVMKKSIRVFFSLHTNLNSKSKV